MKQMNARWLPLNILLLLACSAHAQTTQRFSPDSLNIKGLGTESGSVDVISQDRMNKGLVTNPLSAINGQAAGVNISNGEDRMAQLSSVRVRGTTSLTGGNDPLIIIDGVYSDLATLSTIYPADIERFAILRNAAETAQYGSRGASGVIEVTTKKGAGAAFHISYDGSWGMEAVCKNIEMLSAAEYVATARRLGLAYKDDGYDTNFADAITRTGFVQNHHVAFSGGGPTSSYRASLAYTKNTTVLDMKGMNNLVAKLDIKAGELGALALTGVYEMAKTTDVGFGVGSEVGWSSASRKAVSAGTSGTVKVGHAVSFANAADQTVLVRLCQGLN